MSPPSEQAPEKSTFEKAATALAETQVALADLQTALLGGSITPEQILEMLEKMKPALEEAARKKLEISTEKLNREATARGYSTRGELLKTNFRTYLATRQLHSLRDLQNLVADFADENSLAPSTAKEVLKTCPPGEIRIIVGTKRFAIIITSANVGILEETNAGERAKQRTGSRFEWTPRPIEPTEATE
ncbi:MAG: hypothetical protein WC651_01670 [Candidatus Gracilibacteria bacterium]|jgi:hypothetical protein